MSISLRTVVQRLLVYLGVCAFLATNVYGGDTAQAVADQFYPQSLLQRAADEGFTPLKSSTTAVYDRQPDGSPKTIVALYSNSREGELRILQSSGNGVFEVKADQEDVAGLTKSWIQLVDIDGNGQQEIAVFALSAAGISTVWVFNWDGQTLTDISPEYDSLNASFVDLFHDGKVELLTVENAGWRPGDQSPPPTRTIYRFENGKFKKDANVVVFYCPYVRKKTKPVSDTSSFNIPADMPTTGTILIANGDQSGKDRASSMSITLNGQKVGSPSLLNQEVSKATIEVNNLQPAGNTISIRMDGKPGSQISVLLQLHP